MGVLRALLDSGQQDAVGVAFRSMPRRWQAMARDQLSDSADAQILGILKQ